MRDDSLLTVAVFLFPAKMFAFVLPCFVSFRLPTKIVELCPELLLLEPQRER